MNNFKIKWIGQSGYILSEEETTIYIDPYLSDAVERAEGKKRMVPAAVKASDIKADAFICTHNHLDHLDVDLIAGMNTDGIDFYAPSDCEETLKKLGVQSYIAFDEGSIIKKGGFKIEAVFAEHTIPAIGVVVNYGGIRMYLTGDTYYNSKLENVKCDILFVCINGRLGNMSVRDAVKLTKKIQPKIGVPNHYGMFESNTENPRKYTDNIENGFIMKYNKEYDMKELLARKISGASYCPLPLEV